MVGERRKQYAEYDRQRPFETRRKQDCEQLRLVADFGERDDGGRGEQGFHDNSGAGRLRDSNRHQTRRPARTKVDAIGLTQAVSARKSVVWGKSVSVSVDLGVRCII